MDPARRRFLLGQKVAPIARMEDGCLAWRGITCMTCREMCPEGAISMRIVRGGAVPELDGERCTGCGECVAPCPASAIRLAERSADV
jgi:ferredoxin-type protein NapF